VIETNCYATSRTSEGELPGGNTWVLFTVAEFKAWLVIRLYMGMKRQPNVKSYWMKEGSFLHSSTISKIMSQKWFMALRRCFHFTNPTTYAQEKGLPRYDKLGQTRWLVEKIRENCKRVWRLGKMCTIDEMMVCYKGIYCPLR
jgi:hypothetical protein